MFRRIGQFLALSVLLATCSVKSYAGTLSAASCNEPDVKKVLEHASAGATVLIPSGTCTWTEPLYFTAPANLTLQGQTVCTGSGAPNLNNLNCSDRTAIIDGLSRGSSDPGMLNIETAPTGTFRLTGITFGWGGGTKTDNGSVRLGVNTSEFRLDHVHFNKINALAFSHHDAPNAGGVFDHVLLDGLTGSGWRDYGDFKSNGDSNWASATKLGSNNFVFFEDSTFNNASNDCQQGGRWVIRYNTFNNGGVQTHPTGGAGRARGCRTWELYQNAFLNPTTNNFNVFFISSGTGVIWGNLAPSEFNNFVTLHSMRRDKSTYPELATPNGWGYCGTSFNGTSSNWDQNSDSRTGHRCLDQPGQGKGDLLVGDFPNVINKATGCGSSSPCAWPRESLEPVYEWLNVWNKPAGGNGSYWSNYAPDVLVQNSDFYLYTPSFNGTSGVGSGALGSRPSICTAGTAYWATETNTLYQCGNNNSWDVYYKPYAYPHPLTSENNTGRTSHN